MNHKSSLQNRPATGDGLPVVWPDCLRILDTHSLLMNPGGRRKSHEAVLIRGAVLEWLHRNGLPVDRPYAIPLRALTEYISREQSWLIKGTWAVFVQALNDPASGFQIVSRTYAHAS